jgi:hypothetical protein
MQGHPTMVFRPPALFNFLLVICIFMSSGVFADDARPGTTQIVASYRVKFAGFHFGDVRLTMSLKGPEYQMNGEGRFSVLGGLIYDWRGATASSGKVGKSGPKPSMYTLSYSGGDKHGDVRISFGGGAVQQVSISPKGHPNPRDIPVTKEQLRGVLDPMTGAFVRSRPDLPDADLRVCKETMPVFDGERRFDIILTPKQRTKVENKTPNGYSGFAAVCRVKFVPISGYRPDDSAIKYMSQTDGIEVWLVPLPATIFYVPYRISVPTSFGSGSAELTSFQVDKVPADNKALTRP